MYSPVITVLQLTSLTSFHLVHCIHIVKIISQSFDRGLHFILCGELKKNQQYSINNHNLDMFRLSSQSLHQE